jgi:FAD:protein FMN transferase
VTQRVASFPAFGSTAALLVTDAAAFDDARARLVAEIDAFDLACSRFRDDSELSYVNASAGTATLVSATFIAALETAMRAARLTDGLVDPTVGSTMRMLGYDRDFGDIEPAGPLQVRIERVPGWQTIELRRDHSTVRVPNGVELDFGATAKALCADRAAAAIACETGSGVLISLGGDVSVAGPAPEPGWQLLIADDHAAAPDGPGPRVVIRSGGVATSGTTVRRWRRGEHEVHHVIDPASGASAEEHWRTVSVAAATCVDANIASTAAIVLGASAPAWLDARSLPARLVSRSGGVVHVGQWPAEDQISC